MSDVLFPELPGLEWDLSKKPIFNTKIMESVNGRELRASYQAVPKYEISLSFGLFSPPGFLPLAITSPSRSGLSVDIPASALLRCFLLRHDAPHLPPMPC